MKNLNIKEHFFKDELDARLLSQDDGSFDDYDEYEDYQNNEANYKR